MRERVTKRAIRALVFALLLPLAFSAGLPTLARVIHGPMTHVCHCEARGGHSTCACPICHSDRSDLAFSEESIRGRCGDDDNVFGGGIGLAVLAPTLGVNEAPLEGGVASRPPLTSRARVAPEPSVPPPRSIAA